MLKRSKYDHFWVLGDDVTVIPDLFSIQRNAPAEPRLFRDSSSNTVAGVLLNRNVQSLHLAPNTFSDSTFKGSYIMNIRTSQALDIVCIGENPSIGTELENKVVIVEDNTALKLAAQKEITSDYFYLIEKGFEVSDFFAFDARVTNLIDCHYAWFGEKDGCLSHQVGIKLMNKRLLLEEPSAFLRYEGFLELPDFSGTMAN